MRKRFALMAAAWVATITFVAPAGAQAPSPAPSRAPKPQLTAVEAILVNLTDDGQVVFTRNARTPRAPASLTKIVTALVARDEYDLDEVVDASKLVLQTGGSDLGLEPGMRITIRELLYALMLKSANDAAMALAAYDPGGYEHFVQRMNQKARALGAYDSNFRNPHGLDQVGHVSSARDMAIFTRELMRDKTLAAISGTRRRTMTWKGRDRWYDHHHKMLLRNEHVRAGKTAFTNQAGHSLMTVADTPAGQMIAVVMGSQNQYADTEWLIEYGKQAADRSASGGGAVEGFGQLPAPPEAPEMALARDPVGSDPRDDMRWSVLMIVLGGITGVMILLSRRRPAGAGEVEAWLATLQADAASRR